ncbi:MAG TPA: palindromic element RPE4 domain-containing protein [Rickettsia endosymbiont of Pyrocoelia pectoralis]|nr:palindromic element RPE4 domain-containing protein [Rickettsia endosymbiont of Pyrocoelia pectoralis]
MYKYFFLDTVDKPRYDRAGFTNSCGMTLLFYIYLK